jgi:hypothetical protein
MRALAILAVLSLAGPALADLTMKAQTRPAKNKHGETWIEVQLVTADRAHGVPDARYRITCPDGVLHTGRTDKTGTVFIDHIKRAGTCSIEFPDFDLGEPVSH